MSQGKNVGYPPGAPMAQANVPYPGASAPPPSYDQALNHPVSGTAPYPPQNPGQPVYPPPTGQSGYPPQNPMMIQQPQNPAYPPQQGWSGYPRPPQAGPGYPQTPQAGPGYPQTPQAGPGYPQTPQAGLGYPQPGPGYPKQGASQPASVVIPIEGGKFDAGARFTPYAPPSIPPPPPGSMPNMAQVQAYMGGMAPGQSQVSVEKKKGGFWKGSGGGGYTFW